MCVSIVIYIKLGDLIVCEFTAIIPVRKGSRRLKNKNILPFNGSTLLENKINQLKCVNKISSIVVSSDCDIMLGIANNMGVKTHKRDIIYADEVSKPFGEVVSHICENVSGENIIWAPCVCPLVDSEIYLDAINTYKNIILKGYDSLISVELFKHYLWDDEKPLNYQLGLGHILSQNLPLLYVVMNGIFIAPRLKMIEWKYFHGSTPFKYILDKRSSIDIDDVYDYECAKSWLNMGDLYE
jgi:N-acylneuraminate cytidylyltransferase